MASFNFGQLTRSQYDDYVRDLQYTTDTLITPATLISGFFFKDFKITLNSSDVLQPMNAAGTNIRSYYIRLKIKKLTNAQTIMLKLFNSTKQEDNEQLVDEIKVPAFSIGTDEYMIYETVIKPNNTYDQIHAVLNRNLDDYNIVIDADAGLYGREMVINVEFLQEINNIIEVLASSTNNAKLLKQIGVQSAPGLLMGIDGEPIRVGRTGIYEINYGITIAFLGFVINDDTTTFILDYQY